MRYTAQKMPYEATTYFKDGKVLMDEDVLIELNSLSDAIRVLMAEVDYLRPSVTLLNQHAKDPKVAALIAATDANPTVRRFREEGGKRD